MRSPKTVIQPPPLHGPQARIQMICLAGFMGSGKTTVGTLLARQLAWRFVDLDDRIEESAGLRIPEIFERFGEPAFRQIEADQLRTALGRAVELKESLVLALGGGTYAQPGALEFLRSAGVPVIWLDSPVETLLARCMTMTGRPLFRDEASFRALHAQRLPSYQQADHRVDSSGEPAEVVAEILRRGIVSTGGSEAHLMVEKPQP
ncbi:MAG TPA: shikimate kinase [Candidatus Acidoferrum sp.]|nr:shikimate kinase [Candidatus Acidoferrum sp.]